MDWFERITGFKEQGHAATQAHLMEADGRLVSAHTARRPRVGRLEIQPLGELRAAAAALPRPEQATPLALQHLRGDVRQLHADPANTHALFQVASQFNLLEMVGPDITPEHGVTRYAHDHTQGPACAMAAGAATIYRNYLMPLHGAAGQTAQRQVDTLAGLGERLGNQGNRLWTMRNGYPMFTPQGLSQVDATLAASSAGDRDVLKAQLRIGLHWDVEVTDLEPQGHVVSQAFCSALPIAYQRHLGPQHWQRIATLILEAAYEATLLAGMINHARTGCPIVYLTRLGGGAFGNDPAWIDAAIAHALARIGPCGLQVVMVTFSAAPPTRSS